MTKEEMFAQFEGDDDEFLKFDRIPAGSRHSNRPDLHAFILLDKLVPGDDDIISGAWHDEFGISIDADALAAAATPEIITELSRCGVRCDSETDSLVMFA